MKPEPNKMTKEDFLAIFNDDITVRRKNELLALILKRFEYIMSRLFELNGIDDIDWYDFDNGYDEVNGFFDPDRYVSSTLFEGKWMTNGQMVCDELENMWLPNSWYYEDFENEVALALRDKKEKADNDRMKQQEKDKEKERRTNEVRQRIREKLTPEELSHIKFK